MRGSVAENRVLINDLSAVFDRVFSYGCSLEREEAGAGAEFFAEEVSEGADVGS